MSGGELRLPGAAAGDLGLPPDLGIDGKLRLGGIAAGGLDQAGGSALVVIQQRLQQVFGRDPLVVFSDGDGLRGLQEAFGAVGEFLDVHAHCPSS